MVLSGIELSPKTETLNTVVTSTRDWKLKYRDHMRGLKTSLSQLKGGIVI